MTQRPSPITRSNRQRLPAPGQTGCAGLRKRANLAAMTATWAAQNVSSCEMAPLNTARQGANRSAKTKVPSTT